VRRYAAVLACLAFGAPGLARGAVTVTPEVAVPYVAVGMYFGVDVTLRNTGAAAVSLNLPGTNNLDAVHLEQVSQGMLGGSAGTVDLAPGAEVTVRFRFLALRAGSTSITFVVSQAGGATQLGSGAVSFTIQNVSEVAGARAPAQGRMQIRGNIIRVSNDRRSTDQSAYIVLRGDPGGLVNLTVWGAGRTALGKITTGTMNGIIPGNNDDSFTLDAGGWAGIGWDGTVGGKPLDSGSYWIVATGAVRDRKPFLIAHHQ
jgi:hypothetical protein